MKEDYYDKHHILARHVDKEAKGLSVADNVIKIKRSTHNQLHALFNIKTPIEAIAYLLTLNRSVFTDEFLHHIVKEIQMYMNNYYKKECYKWVLRREIQTVLDLDNIL